MRPMRRLRRLGLILLGLLGLGLFGAPAVQAQTPPTNPTTLTFDHTDFAQTDLYEVGYFATAAAVAPVQTATLAKPATCSPCAGSLPSRPTQFGTWYVAVRANAGGATPVSSDWSNRVPFVRAPVAPVVRGVN